MVTRATLTQFEVLEQNWLGQGWTNGVVSPGWGPERLQDVGITMTTLCISFV